MAIPTLTREELISLLFKDDTIQFSDTDYYELKEHYVQAICQKINKQHEGELILSRDGLNKTVVIITDGGCSNNGKENSCGGWGVMLITMVHDKIIAMTGEGSIPGSSNNQSELIAVREGFRMLKTKVKSVHVICDSTYAIGALNGTNKRKKNTQLIFDIEAEINEKVETTIWTHTDGHAGFHPNDLVDILAKENAGSKY